MRPIDADRALEIVRDQAIAHPNAYHLTNYATLILREAPTLTDLSKCLAFNSTADDKPQTNADRIRAMSDEELARKLVNASYRYDWKQDEDYWYFPNGTTKTNYKPKAIEAWLEWLKQPGE